MDFHKDFHIDFYIEFYMDFYMNFYMDFRSRGLKKYESFYRQGCVFINPLHLPVKNAINAGKRYACAALMFLKITLKKTFHQNG